MVDVDYPEYLQPFHRVFLPEKRIINRVTKLVCTFYDVYVCQIGLLKQALKHGLILKSVHGILKFKHIRWVELYITSNVYFRTTAENNFEKDSNKLVSNSVFGKSIQSGRYKV